MKPRALVLVDGEHYPPVTLDAIAAMARDYEVVAAVFAGGGEKLSGPLTLGALPVVRGDGARDALSKALGAHEVDVVIDCSDAPVVGSRMRFALASLALARGVAYRGAGFSFDVPPRPVLTRRPTIAVIGTGKRAGKTAVAAALARHASSNGAKVVIVAMGRGGHAEPVVTHPDELDVHELLARADRGEHAATDAYEDALTARVTTVSARRAGAGLAGAPLHDTVEEAIAVANDEHPDLIILEGSGTAIPPARADATILVAPDAGPPEDLSEGLAAYRLLISDLVVVTMFPEPVLPTETISALSSQLLEFSRDIPVVGSVLWPQPLGSVAGRKIFFATTAPAELGPALQEHLERSHAAVVVGRSHRLADREGLAKDLAGAEGTYEVLLTELKAAAIDVAARAAVASGAQVIFCDNAPEGLEMHFAALLQRVGIT